MGMFDFLKATVEDNQLEQRNDLSNSFSSIIDTTSVDEEKILRISAVSSCLELISGAIGQLPIYLYKEEDNGDIEKVKDDFREFLLNQEPNPVINGYNFKKSLVKDFLIYGAAYVALEKKGNSIEELHLLRAKSIRTTKYINGYKLDAEFEYSTSGEGARGSSKPITFKPHELAIFLKESHDGLTSIGLLKKGKDVFAQALNEMEYSTNIFNKGALPIGVLETANRLTRETATRLRESWQNLYGGVRNSGKTVVLEEGLTYKPISLNPSDLQLGDTRKNTISEICRLFNLPENMINYNAVKYGNVEQNNLNFLQYTLSPILSSIEATLNKSLLLEEEKEQGYFFAFDTSDILKTTLKEQYDAIRVGLDAGVITLNEARYKMNLKALNDNYLKWTTGAVLYNVETGELIIPNMAITSNGEIGNLEKDNNKEEQPQTDNKPNEEVLENEEDTNSKSDDSSTSNEEHE